MGRGEEGGGACPGICFAILWFLGLIFVGWPVGFLLSWLYIALLPFSVCIEPVKGVADAVLKLVQLPIFFTEKMVNMEGCGGGGGGGGGEA